MKRVIVKISGEAFAGAEGFGIDASSATKVAQQIQSLVERGYQVGVVSGAGNIWRGRNCAQYGMDKADADQMGMLSTILNSLALKNALKKIGIEAMVLTSVPMPSIAELFTKDKAIKALESGIVTIFGGGTGLPFFTTDSCAALRAAEVKAEAILMAKHGVDGVYDDDPNVNKNAKRFATLTYQDILVKQLHVMDATAAALCQENNIKTIVFDADVPENVYKVLENPSIGTIIEK